MRYKYYLLSDWANQINPASSAWPVQGKVEVLDWDPSPALDGGIWGYLQPPTNNLLPAVLEEKTSTSTDLVLSTSQWVVLGSNEVVQIDEQIVKCPWGMVLYCGDRVGASKFVDLIHTNAVRCEYLGEEGMRRYMYIGRDGSSISTGERSLVIAGGDTNIDAGDHGTLIGGRNSQIMGGNRTIVSGGKGAKVLVGNKATVAGGDHVEAGAGHSSTVVGGYKSNVLAGTLSTVVGGYKSRVTGGYGATVVGGEKALVTGGDHATVIGGDDSLVFGGDYAQVFGGLRSKVCGGVDATLRIAYLDQKGERCTATAYVGRYGILPDVVYSFDGESWCEE